MCDASDYAVGVVLGQCKDKQHYAISYASKTLTGPQLNYATIEKELLVMVSPWTSSDPTWLVLK